jgi:hypothetical protein
VQVSARFFKIARLLAAFWLPSLKFPDLQFCIFGQRIQIHCDDIPVRTLILANYGAFEETSGPADLEYSITRRPSCGFCIKRAGETLVEETVGEATLYLVAYYLEKLITIELQQLRKDLYFVHSSALERNAGAVMIVAESGTGKSTTSWALLQHGFGYLSDELAPIDPVTLDVHPYPHALCLKAAPPDPYPLPDRITRTERTLHIPVKSLPRPAVTRPTPLRALLFLRRDGSVSLPTYTEVSPGEAGARLYANTLNALAHPSSGLEVAVDIASAVRAFVLNAGELRATCELISNLEEQIQSSP